MGRKADAGHPSGGTPRGWTIPAHGGSLEWEGRQQRGADPLRLPLFKPKQSPPLGCRPGWSASPQRLAPAALLLLALAGLLAFLRIGAVGGSAISSLPLSETLGQPSAAGTSMSAVADELPAEEPVLLGNSAHTCMDAASPVERVCTFQSLLLHNGSLYYVSEDPDPGIPLVDVHYLSLPPLGKQEDPKALFGPGYGLLVRNRSTLPWGSGAVAARVLDNAYLWFARMGDNLGHGLAEEALSLHNSMCKYTGSCHYSQRAQQHVVLLPGSRLLPALNDTLAQCMSRAPVLTLRQWSDWAGAGEGVVLLRNVTVGIGPDCRAMADCRPPHEGDISTPKRPRRMSAAMVAGWRQRIGDCLGFDAQAAASLAPLRVVILDRVTESGRHFTNVRSVEGRVRQVLPGADVRVVYMEGLSIREQVQAVHQASILLMMHGAALGLWPFLPRNAVGIHVVPHPASEHVQMWAERMADTLAEPANISYVPLTNRRPGLLRFHIDQLQASREYRRLPPEERLALLEEGRCPQGDLYKHCLMHFVRKSVDLELDLGQLEEALRQAVRDLLAKYPGGQTAALPWAAGVLAGQQAAGGDAERVDAARGTA